MPKKPSKKKKKRIMDIGKQALEGAGLKGVKCAGMGPGGYGDVQIVYTFKAPSQ